MPKDIGGLTLVPGVYCFSSSAQLTGTVTLDAQGNSAAVWVFKVGSTVTTASNSTVLLVNGAQNCNVFWQVGSSATIGTGTRFVGHILALTSITVNTNAIVSGSVLARNGAVTLDSNAVAMSACAVASVAPTLGKTFSPSTIVAGGNSTLTITLTNAGPTASALTAPLTDNLPAGLTTIGRPATTCGGTVAAGSSSVTLSGGSIAANSSCTVTVGVTAPNGGNHINSIPRGALQTNHGSNIAPAVATLAVTPPTSVALGKTFNPATILTGGTSSLVITLSNAGPTASTMTAPLTDTLPTGVTIAGAPGTTCGGTVTAGSSSVTLTGGSIPLNSSCTVTVAVTATSDGNFVNLLASGALQTNNGSNTAPALATLTVAQQPTSTTPPTLGKAFGPATINAGGTSTLTITLSNPDATAAVLSAPLADRLPGGVTISGAPSTTCGGTVAADTTSVTLSGGSIPANGSCTVTVDVTAANGGNYINSLAAGALQTGNGSNSTPAVATLTVTPPSTVTLGKTFDPATINAGGTSVIMIVLSNGGDTPATLTAPLTDLLPSGVTITGDFQNTCGGTITWSASSLTMTGGTIPAHGTCTIGSGIPVTALVPGSYYNVLPAGALQTTNGSNANSAVSTLTVTPLSIVTIRETFEPEIINVGDRSMAMIFLSNSGDTAATLTSPFTYTMPVGVTITGDFTNTCGGTITHDSRSLTMTGGSIPAHGDCTIGSGIPVTASAPGSYLNTLAANSVETSNGKNSTPAAATLTVVPADVQPVAATPVLNAGAPGAGLLLGLLLAAVARRRRPKCDR